MKNILNYLSSKTDLKNDLLKAFITAFTFSFFIYAFHYGFSFKILNSIFALIAFFMFINLNNRAILLAGYLVGLFWFYWIGYSFEYQNVMYMKLPVAIGFGFIYLIFFSPLLISKNVFYRAFVLFALSFFEPFDYNWLTMELPFINSFFGIQKYQYTLILVSLALSSFFVFKNDKRLFVLPALLLIFAIDFTDQVKELPNLKIKTVQTDILQKDKWKRKNLNPIISMNLREIQKAIDENYDIVVLPESTFPLYLNHHPMILEELKKLSYKIGIVAGALYSEDNKHYNVNYILENGNVKIAKKMILVPFGEYVPLPKVLRDWVNKTFFNSTSDFVTAKEPTSYKLKGVEFTNAICYETTCSEIYEKHPKYIIANSNNAWFDPSIEHSVQRLLMMFYAKKYNAIIFHSTNNKGSGVIK